MANASFATRLFLILTGCIAAAVTVSTLIDYQWAKRDILRNVERLTEITVADTIEDMDSRIIGVESSTQMFARILSQQAFTESEMRQMLEAVVGGREDIFGAAIAVDPRWSTTTDGYAPYYFRTTAGQLSYVALHETMDYIVQPWFREVRDTQQALWGEPYFDEGGADVLMSTYSAPLFREQDGEQLFFGVVTADLALRDLSLQMRSFQLGDSGIAFLLSRQGKILAAPNAANLMQPLLSVLPTGQEIDRWNQVLVQAQTGKTASFTGPCARMRGDCVVNISPLKSNGWPLGVIYSEQEMLAPLRAELLRLALTGLLGVALIAVAVSIVSRRLTRPLAALVTVTDNVAAGNFDAPMPRVYRQDEIGRLVSSFASMQKNLRAHIEQLKAETARRNRLQGELNAATDIQLAMLPDAGNSLVEDPRFQLWAYQRPAKSVGGDLYTYFLRGDNELIFAVGDVSDKGVPAALFMARAVTVLQQQIYSELSPAHALQRLNNELEKGNDNCMFVTLFFAVLDLNSLQLHFSSAGHTAPSLLRDRKCLSVSQEAGPALALMSGLEFPANVLQLQPNDLLAVYTDGIDEAFNVNREQFTTERFNRLLEQSAARQLDELGSSVFEAIDQHAADMPQSDDITCLLLRLPTVAGERSSLHLADEPGAIDSLLHWLKSACAEAGLDAATSNDLLLVSEEAVTNIFKYAELPKTSKVEVTFEAGLNQTSLTFRDAGLAFDPLAEATRAVLGVASEHAAIGGLGVHLLLALTDTQHYRRTDGSNVLALSKHKKRRA